MHAMGRHITLIVCLLYTLHLTTIAEQTKRETHAESRLFNDLFTKTQFTNTVRPVRNKTRAVQVSLDVALVQLVDLDDGSQVMSTNLWIRQKWQNEILTWEPNDYGNVTSLVVDKKHVWTPDIVLYNNAENAQHGGSIDQFKTRVKVAHDGLNTWYIPAILKSSCGTDITFFPFDIQVCEMKFGSWTYLSHQINLTNVRDTMDLAAYLNSSSFYLRKTETIRNVVYYPCCPNPFIDITFKLTLERQAGFYVFNVILPCLVITLFALLNFMLPDLIGERMGLVFDCILAITFTSMMLNDMLPVSSDTTPVITKFMLVCMLILFFSVMTSAISMRCRTELPMPKYMRFIFLEILGPLLFITSCPCVCKLEINDRDGKVAKGDNGSENDTEFVRRDDFSTRKKRLRYRGNYDADDEAEKYEMYCLSQESFSESSGYPETSDSSYYGDSKYYYGCKSSDYVDEELRGNFWDQPLSSGFNSLESEPKPSKHQLECLRNVESLVEEQQRQIDDWNVKDFWRFVSQIADRVFLLCFSISWLLMVMVMFLRTPLYRRREQ